MKSSPYNDGLQLREKSVFVAFIFLALVTSTFMGTATISKLTSTVSGSSNVRVAVFAADVQSSTTGDLEINCNEGNNTAAYTFSVTNTENGAVSEVDLEYSVAVTLSTGLPAGMTMTLDGNNGTASSDGKTYTFEDASWILDANKDSEVTHTLLLEADPDIVTSNITISKINVHVVTAQVD